MGRASNSTQVTAAADRHLVYLQTDTIPPPEVGPTGHGDPAVDEPLSPAAAVRQAAAQVEPSVQALVNSFPQNYPVSIQVYEHLETVFATHDRWVATVNWASELRAKFRGSGVLPRTVADCQGQSTPVCQGVLPIAVVVPRVTISSWRTISVTDYGDNCDDNLRKFENDTEAGLNGVPFFRHLQLLFASPVTGGFNCGGNGRAGKPGVPGTTAFRLYSFVKGNIDVTFLTSTVMMEIGHNLDWHADNTLQGGNDVAWRCVARDADQVCTNWLPHDPHVSPEIAEFELIAAGPLLRCIAMYGNYGNCSDPQPTYSWASGRPLQHLAEGIAILFLSSEQ